MVLLLPMNIYKFRVIIDTEEDVFRDIEISTDSNFLDLHASILRAFNWEGGEMASFYKSNENWDKGEDIPLMEMGAGGNEKNMSNTLISDEVGKPHEKLIYVYDFLRMWCFYIELIEVKKASSELLYPRLVLEYGDAPDQNSKEMDLFDDLDMSMFEEPKKKESTGDPELDEYLMDDEEEDDIDFENLDDLEDLI